MYEPLKMDWKLFQDKVKDWQESYMARAPIRSILSS